MDRVSYSTVNGASTEGKPLLHSEVQSQRGYRKFCIFVLSTLVHEYLSIPKVDEEGNSRECDPVVPLKELGNDWKYPVMTQLYMLHTPMHAEHFSSWKSRH